KWDDIKIFIEYGMLTDEKFCESAMNFVLVKDTENKYFTLEEYRNLISPEQTDKNGDVVYLYATDPVAQFNFIKAATNRGYSVLVMDGQLENHFIAMLEQKIEKSRFVRVDSDTVDNLIPKDNKKNVDLTETQRNILTNVFRSQVPEIKDANFVVTFEAMSPADLPVTLTQNEYMRRMKEMASMQPGMNFYGELPDSYNFIVNTENQIIVKLRDKAEADLRAEIEPLENEIKEKNDQITAIRSAAKDGKLDAEQEKQSNDLQAQVDAARKKQEEIVGAYAKSQPVVGQLIDIALLGNGLLKGEQLSRFIERSVELLK
ncbi:MAG: molecular chaperone HtpG, partial [Muribaculaceae bacterium]|nr:molecular chaperone HtpG [Muribaculaceae bacterium]